MHSTDKKHMHSTEFSRCLKKEYKITWNIAAKAHAYDNATKRCDLYLTRKLFINGDKRSRFNKTSELHDICVKVRHFSSTSQISPGM